MSDTALLLIDLQRDFLETTGRLPVGAENADRVIAASLRIMNHALTAGWKLIFVKNEFKKHDWLGNFSRNNAAIAGSPGAGIDPRISVPANAEIFSKAKSDAFSNPALEASLKASSIRQIVMLGLMTEECVCDTARSALRRGFNVVIVADGVASSEDVAHQRGLERMHKAGAEIKESGGLLRPGST